MKVASTYHTIGGKLLIKPAEKSGRVKLVLKEDGWGGDSVGLLFVPKDLARIGQELIDLSKRQVKPATTEAAEEEEAADDDTPGAA